MKFPLAVTVCALASVASAKTVVIMPENGDTATKLGVGDTLEVRFSQNAGTGYRWVLGERQSERLLMFDRSDVVPSRGNNVPGGPTTQRFQYIAKTSGSGVISFDLYGPGKNKKIKSVSVRVEVAIPASVIKVFATDNDNGNGFQLGRGQWLEVRLTTQPSTGYSWKLDPKSISAFTLRSNEGRNSKGGMPGQPTVQVFVLVATKKGTDTPKFEYVGPDGRTVGKRYSITAQVRD
jgi:predicted secreted protein